VMVRYANQLLLKCWLGWYRFHRMRKVSRLRRLGARLWRAEDFVAKALWGVETVIERRLRRRPASASALRKGRGGAAAADDDDDDLDEYEYFVDPLVGAVERGGGAAGPLLPAMDGPFAARRLDTSSAARAAVHEYQQQQAVRSYERRQTQPPPPPPPPDAGAYMQVAPLPAGAQRFRPYGVQPESSFLPEADDLRPRGYYGDGGAGVGVTSYHRSETYPTRREEWSGDPSIANTSRRATRGRSR